MKKVSFAVFFVLILLPPAVWAQAVSASVSEPAAPPVSAASEVYAADIGGVRVNVPTPAGLREVTTLSATLADMARRFVPENGRLLALYLPAEAAAEIQAGRLPRVGLYASLQTPSALMFSSLTSGDVQALLEAARQRQEDLFSNGEEIQDRFDRSAESFAQGYKAVLPPQFSGAQPLGLFWESGDALGFGHILRRDVPQRGTVQPADLAVATALVVLRGKLLLAQVYRPYAAAADVTDVQQRATAWISALLQANDPALIAAQEAALRAEQEAAAVRAKKAEEERQLRQRVALGLMAAAALVVVAALAVFWRTRIKHRA